MCEPRRCQKAGSEKGENGMSEWLNGDGLILSEHYDEVMNGTVQPYLQARETVLTVKGDREKPLYCVVWRADQPHGTVMVVHGFTENVRKYAELVFSLLRNGLNVVAYDQRGHGRSWRDEAVARDPSLTHVDGFGEYVRDMCAVCSNVLKEYPEPWSVFAHSMGGAVTCLFLSEHPEVFSRAVLCAPMIAPYTGGAGQGAVRMLCGAMRLLGQGKKRIFASRPYSGPEDFDTSCATGRARFEWYDRLKQNRAEFRNNGPTYNWTLEAINVTKKILAAGVPEKIACPVRLYSAERDDSVLPEEQQRFIARVRNGVRIPVPGSRHEIYRSGDDVLFPWWHEVLAFLKGS